MKKINYILIFISISIFHYQRLSAQNLINNLDSKKSLIDSIIENKMKQSGIVGIGAAIIIDKKLVWEKGYGYSDKEKGIAFTPSTVMNIASISKTFTGFCMMKAVEEEKVSLDEDINNYLPFKVVNPNFPDEKITLRRLATHTSGLTDRYPFYTDSTYIYDGQKAEDLGIFLKNYYVKGGKYYSKDNFLNAKPGKIRDYSNIATGLTGYIVELRTGKKLNAYGKQFIFNSLKMKNSGWFLSEIDMVKHSKLYAKKEGKIEQIPLYEGITYPDGGVRTSVDELSRFFITLLNDGEYNGKRLLKKELAQEMLRFQYTEKNKPDSLDIKKMNSGIFWSTKLGGTRIGHNGSDPGVRTFMLSDLEREIGVVVFFNTSLDEKDENVFFGIYEALYRYGQKIKQGQ
ncbi:serine hydrolase domain-containing protein [Pedobacter sp. AW31-3R]|uniref:serine hydrolase domain-containing protein n=1 Tax=Pedobacter sp. AW31-3R TaxID=3445781 RepID=UPI003FA1588C